MNEPRYVTIITLGNDLLFTDKRVKVIISSSSVFRSINSNFKILAATGMQLHSRKRSCRHKVILTGILCGPSIVRARGKATNILTDSLHSLFTQFVTLISQKALQSSTVLSTTLKCLQDLPYCMVYDPSSFIAGFGMLLCPVSWMLHYC